MRTSVVAEITAPHPQVNTSPPFSNLSVERHKCGDDEKSDFDDDNENENEHQYDDNMMKMKTKKANWD